MKYIFNHFQLLLFMIILLSTGNIIAQEEEIIEEEVIEDEIVIKEERKVISLTELAEIMSADKSEITIYNYKIIASEKDEKTSNK